MAPKNAKPKKIPFTSEEDEILIEHVSSFEYMWNTKHADYKSNYKREKVWQDIADNLGKNRGECQRRWKTIRDHYKRQTKEDTSTSGSAEIKRRANYWHRLSFLDKTEEQMDTSSNISVETPERNKTNCQQDGTNETISQMSFEQTLSEPEETSELPTITTIQRKRRMENSNITSKEKKGQNTQLNDSFKELLKSDDQDDVDLFFKSIAMTVKKLKPHLVRKTKIKILEMVSEMEELQDTSN